MPNYVHSGQDINFESTVLQRMCSALEIIKSKAQLPITHKGME